MTDKVNGKSLILKREQVAQKLKRMAFEILEYNLQEKVVVLAGIYDKGYDIAIVLKKEMSAIAPDIEVKLVKIEIDKENPIASDIRLNCSPKDLENKCVVLVDDVLNSGRTMAYSMSVLLDANIKKLETATLIDRSHKRFPINANYKGFELSTTIEEHVEVVLGKNMGVYLY